MTEMSYAYALGEARSCLAALADTPGDVEMSAQFDRLLIELDSLTGDAGPACSLMSGTRVELLDRLEDVCNSLVGYGVDGLSLELLLLRAWDPLWSAMP